MFKHSAIHNAWDFFADPLVSSAITNAERRSRRFGDTFFVVRFVTGVEVISVVEKLYRSREIIDVIYNTSSGFEVGSLQLERWCEHLRSKFENAVSV